MRTPPLGIERASAAESWRGARAGLESRVAPLFCSVALCLASVAGIAAQDSAGTREVRVELVPSASTVRAGDTVRVALRIEIAPGWHIYGTDPGEAGLPTTVHWESARGVALDALEWPLPIRKITAGLVVHAYEGEVIALTRVRLPASLRAGDTVGLAARVEWAACRDVCIRQRARVAVSLRVVASPPDLRPPRAPRSRARTVTGRARRTEPAWIRATWHPRRPTQRLRVEGCPQRKVSR